MPEKRGEGKSRTRELPRFVYLVLLLLVCGFWSVLARAWFYVPATNDFLTFYSAGSLALQGRFNELYDPAAIRAAEAAVAPERSTFALFVRPPFYAAVLAPLALIPFKTAFYVWLVLMCGLLGGCWWWLWKRYGNEAALLFAFFLPAFVPLADGQDSIYVAAAVLAAYALFERDRPFSAGLTLAVGLIKFHLLLLVPVALVAQRQFRMLSGFGVGAGIALLWSCYVSGFRGVLSYASFLIDFEARRETLQPFDGLYLLVGAHGLALQYGSWLLYPVVLGVLFLTVLAIRRRRPAWQWFSLILLANVLVVPNVFLYDLVLLLLPLQLPILLSNSRTLRLIGVPLCTPLPYFFPIRPLWLLLFFCAFAIWIIRGGTGAEGERSRLVVAAEAGIAQGG